MPAPQDIERLPFPPGEAPFRLKGTAYRGHIDYVQANVPGGLAAQNAAFRSAKLRAFFEQSFLATSWYDVFPLMVAGYVCARIVGTTFSDFVRTRARWQAQQDVGGVYKLILHAASPELVVEKMPTLMARYFDFGRTTVEATAPRTYQITVSGLPSAIAPWYALICETYALVALEANGAKNPRARLLPSRREGQAHGLDVVQVRCDVLWDEG